MASSHTFSNLLNEVMAPTLAELSRDNLVTSYTPRVTCHHNGVILPQNSLWKVMPPPSTPATLLYT